MEKSNSIGWFIAGVLVGAAGAVVLAPKSGKDTRKFIAQTTRESSKAVEDRSEELMERGKDLYERGKNVVEDASELFERGRKLVRG